MDLELQKLLEPAKVKGQISGSSSKTFKAELRPNPLGWEYSGWLADVGVSS